MIRLLAFLALANCLVAADARRSNVLLICVDDLKPALGCYGDPLAKTPNIDRLAARGLRFDAAYTNQAVCAPSRNSLMLGTRPTTIGVYTLGMHFRTAVPEAVTMTQYFMRHGWRAEGMGKILHVGHGNINDQHSWSVPFHSEKLIEYVDPANTGIETREEILFNPTKGKKAAEAKRGPAWERPDVPDTAYGDGRLADEAIKRLRAAKAKPGEPLFLAVGFARPHLPFSAPKKYWDLYDPAKLPLATRDGPPDGAPAYAGKTTSELNQYEPIPPRGAVPLETQRELVHGYYASVSFMDAQVGRVLDELDRLGMANDTVVVLWGDHGYHLGDHGMWTKHTNYEQATRIPILVIAPGVTKPKTATKALIETVDIFPTLAELAGLPAPANLPQGLDGRSVVPVLRDPSKTVRDHAYHAYPRGRGAQGEWIGRALRSDRYRFVEWKKPGAAPETADLELYDCKEDAGETKNLAGERLEVVKEMRALLAKHPEAVPQRRN